MSEEKFKIEMYHDSDRNEVARLLTDSFLTNPAYSIIFKKEKQREEGLLWLFNSNLLMHNYKHTLTRIVREIKTGKIVGTYTLYPPGDLKTPLSVYFKIGLPCFLLKFGLNPLNRMLDLDQCNNAALAEAIQVPEYHYLSNVAIREGYRGSGLGSFAIGNAIRELRDSNPTCRILGLTTQLPENVSFYSRLGFTKLSEGEIDFKGDRYYNYNMKLEL